MFAHPDYSGERSRLAESEAMMNDFQRFRESYHRVKPGDRVPWVGDPQTATDQRPRGIFDPRLQRGGSEQTRVPDTGPQPHDVPHSRPPGNPGGPDTRPAPPLPPVRRRQWRCRR
jgi:hypothetical protein